MTPQLYSRDLAITAVICFIGGAGLTLLVVLIYYRVSHRKKLKEIKRQKEEEEGNTTVINNHVSHLDVGEKRGDVFLQASSSQPLDRRAMMLDTRLENHGGHFQFRADEVSHFRCPDCNNKGQRGMGPNPRRWNNRINREMEAEDDIDSTETQTEKKKMWMMTEEDRKKPGTQQGILWRDMPDKPLSLVNSNSSSHPWREAFNERPDNLPAYKTGRDMDSYRTDVESNSSGHETLLCNSCHRTYRPPEQTMRQGRIHTNIRDSALYDSFPQHRLFDKGTNVNHNQFDTMKNTKLRRELRNVTFDLECLKKPEQGNVQGENKMEERARTSRDKKKGGKRRRKVKIQSSQLLRVKLNLSPLRKSKVHPKTKNEQGHLDKSSSKKNKEKWQDGKQREGKEGKPSSRKKTKSSSDKMKKCTKSTGSSEEQKDEEGAGEGKTKTTYKQKKTTSKSEPAGQETMAADHDENTRLDNSHSGDTTSTADQSASGIAIGQRQNLQGGSIQYQGAGLVLGNTQLSSQHALSLSAAERNSATNLSLLGSAGSQLTGSSLSLQGGNSLVNTPVSNALFPSGPTNSMAAGIAISGPNLASSGALHSFHRQTGEGLMSPATSLLANNVHTNPMQASGIQPGPLHNSQGGRLSLNLAANPAIYLAPNQTLSQSQLPPDSSPLVAQLKCGPAQGPGLQTGEGHQVPPESQAPESKESVPVQAQAPPSTDGLSVVASQALGSVTTMESLSKHNSEIGTGQVPGESTINKVVKDVVLTEGPALGASGDSMQAANVSVLGVSVHNMSAQSGSSTGATAVAAASALLQQEYVSEEGGSSPRRKLRLVLPEKASSRPATALERKIR